MNLDTLARRLTGAILSTSVFALSLPAPALAQKPPIRVINLPCCKCIGGQSATVSLNSGSGSGTVPYNVTGPGVGGPIAQTLLSNTIHPYWTATLSPAQWIHANDTNGMGLQPGGTYTYSVRFRIPKCTIPMSVHLAGQAAADDSLKVFIHHVQTNSTTQIGASPMTPITTSPTVSGSSGGWGFRSERIASLPWNTNVPGDYVLRFEVVNGSAGPTGLLVRAAIRTICPTKLAEDGDELG